MRYRKHITTKKNIRLRIAAVSVALFTAFVWINNRVNPILKTMTSVQAGYIANIAIDQAAAEVLAESDIMYDRLISLNTLSDGTVCSMTANIREMNIQNQHFKGNSG